MSGHSISFIKCHQVLDVFYSQELGHNIYKQLSYLVLIIVALKETAKGIAITTETDVDVFLNCHSPTLHYGQI